MTFIYLTVIAEIFGMKRHDLRYLGNISGDHLRLAQIDRCKLQTM